MKHVKISKAHTKTCHRTRTEPNIRHCHIKRRRKTVMMTSPVEITTQGLRPKYAFMIRDEYSGLTHMYPLSEKSARAHEAAIQLYLGTRQRLQLHSDNSSEVLNTASNLAIPHSMSEPGVPQTNAFAERANRDVLEGTRTVLVLAGLPSCFGPICA